MIGRLHMKIKGRIPEPCICVQEPDKFIGQYLKNEEIGDSKGTNPTSRLFGKYRSEKAVIAIFIALLVLVMTGGRL